jgi:alcohol dehydrogenase class IV
MTEVALDHISGSLSQSVWEGRGGLDRLGAHLGERSQNIVVVGSHTRIHSSNLQERLPHARIATFSDFASNPPLRDVRSAINFVTDQAPDLVIGLGGGSAMDTAKLARALVSVAPSVFRPDPPGLILLPTLAGSGSEITRFATFYEGRTKCSVDDRRLLADLVIADPSLVAGAPRKHAASSALDAVAQCLESLWARASTSHSRELAASGLRVLSEALPLVHPELDDETAELLVRASLDGGRAIDVTRTTAAHAFAYPMTAMFGVPHGLAATLHLIWLVPYVLDNLNSACSDPRGATFVRQNIELAADALGAADPRTLAATLEQLVAGCGFATNLGEYGVNASHLTEVIRSALVTSRADNLPVLLDPDEIRRRLERRL